MKIRCLIDRQGPTTVQYNGARFDFEPNEHGHYVCDVANPGAVRYFLETFANPLYEVYAEPVAVVEEAKAGSILAPSPISDEASAALAAAALTKDAMLARYAAMTTKNDIEAACLKDFKVNLNKSFGIPNLKLQVADLIAKKFEA